MKKIQTFLLVDDSLDSLLLMHAAFNMAKCLNPLQDVQSGEQAIAYLKGEGAFQDRAKFPLPTVMILDLSMPRKNGFEVLAWVRAQPGLKRLAIVILSASVRVEDVERAFDLGATSYLVKPLSLNELTAMMRCLSDWVNMSEFPSLEDCRPTTT